MKKMLLLLVCLTTFAWLHAEDVTVNLNLADPTTLVNKDGSLGAPASGKGLDYDYFGKDDVWVSVDFGTVTNKDSHLRFYGSNPITWRCSKNGGTAGQKFTISAPGNITKIEFTGTLAVTASPTGLSGKIWTGNSESVTFKTTAANTLSAIAVTYTKVDETKVAAPTFSHESGEVEAGTKVEIDCKTADAKIYYTTDETDPTETSTFYDASTGIIVNEAMTVKAIAVKEGLNDSEIATATYTIKKPVVATPTFDPESGEVEKGRKIGIFCTTEGAKIYYTTDNTTPNAESMLYDAASGIIVDKAMTIKAIAIAEGYNDSEVATVTYSIKGEAPMSYTAQFDFSDPTKLNPAQDYPSFEGMNPSGSVTRVLVAGVEFTNNYVVAEFVAPGNATATNTPQIMYNADAENNKIAFVRAFKNSGLKITGLRQLQVEKIEITGTDLNNVLYNGTAVNSSAKTELVWERPAVSALAETSENDVVEFKISSSKAVSINTIKVTTLDITNGVDDIIVDENAPVEYYNLQGVRVANPENGIYIRRQGSKVSKVLVK